jgi:hypothetical protein
MNWIVLTSLHTIYQDGKVRVKKTLEDDPHIQHLLTQTHELQRFAGFYKKGHGFDQYYKNNHKNNYDAYIAFLERNQLLKSQLRFEEDDIRILIEIETGMDSGDLQELRNQIVTSEETVRGVSRMFFKNEKYLLNSEALTNAVKQLLNIKELADDRDQQYRYVLDCDNPKLIVLCENIDFLKRPTMPRKHNIELWYAGGKNITKLDYVDTRGLPIYYSGDWDYDGLKIFEAVKRKIPEIILLLPNGIPKSITETEHNSLWRHDSELSGLNQSLFDAKEQQIITLLMKNNEWIIEESNELLKMVQNTIGDGW